MHSHSDALHEDPDAKEITRQELLFKTVHAGDWPRDTSEAAVRKVFPTATGVTLQMEGKRFTGSVLVEFASAEEAKELAGKRTKVCGKALKLKWAGVNRLESVSLLHKCARVGFSFFPPPQFRSQYLSKFVWGMIINSFFLGGQTMIILIGVSYNLNLSDFTNRFEIP